MAVLRKGQKADPRRMPREKFELPECGEGCYVMLRALTAPEVTEWLADSTEEKPASDYVLLSLCMVDDQGEPIYSAELGEDGKELTSAADVCRRELAVSAPHQIAMVRKILDLSEISRKAQAEREKN